MAQLFDLPVRGVGLGWASGVGRIGAIVGPTLGGVLVAQPLPLRENFLIFAIPAAVAAAAMLVFALASARNRVPVAVASARNDTEPARSHLLAPDLPLEGPIMRSVTVNGVDLHVRDDGPADDRPRGPMCSS